MGFIIFKVDKRGEANTSGYKSPQSKIINKTQMELTYKI